MRAIVCAFVLAVVVSSAVTIDRWSLDGHGVARALYSGGSASWMRALDQPNLICNYTSYYTPFAGYHVNAGSALRDDGILHIPLTCYPSAGGPTHAYVWALNADTGRQVAFVALSYPYWDSYLKYMPDGSVAAGANGDRVVVLHRDDLHVVFESTGIVQGNNGAQVLALTKTSPPQVTSAGGDGGWWWGSKCDIVNGHEFTKCESTIDSTVCMGADGKTLYNNQRFESPQGVTRFKMPFPTTPDYYNSDYIDWPWWIRSDVAGNVYAYSGYAFLTKYARDMSTTWRVPALSAMGLMLSDDESTIVLSNATHLWTLSTATGTQSAIFGYASFGAASCQTVVSPWQNPTPVPMPDGRVALACADATGATFAKLVNLQTKRVEAWTGSLVVPPDQVLVDSNYQFYSIGTVQDKPTVQRVNMAQHKKK